jgi:hypothetical protein
MLTVEPEPKLNENCSRNKSFRLRNAGRLPHQSEIQHPGSNPASSQPRTSCQLPGGAAEEQKHGKWAKSTQIQAAGHTVRRSFWFCWGGENVIFEKRRRVMAYL